MAVSGLASSSPEVEVPALTIWGVDEHVWSHTRRGSMDVTVIIDLTPIRDGTRLMALSGTCCRGGTVSSR